CSISVVLMIGSRPDGHLHPGQHCRVPGSSLGPTLPASSRPPSERRRGCEWYYRPGVMLVARLHKVPLPSTMGNGRIARGGTTERPFMSDNSDAPRDRDTLLDDFVAEITRVAYRVALRHGTAGVWRVSVRGGG